MIVTRPLTIGEIFDRAIALAMRSPLPPLVFGVAYAAVAVAGRAEIIALTASGAAWGALAVRWLASLLVHAMFAVALAPLAGVRLAPRPRLAATIALYTTIQFALTAPL
jgi:hypothetical protein